MSEISATSFGKVAVLMGGWAAERDISLLSGNAVLQGLLSRGVDAHAVDVDRNIVEVLAEGQYARAFVVLHGRGGEDGVIQGALEILGLPYTGSGVLGSALGMDKYRCKLLWQGMGLPTPAFAMIHEESDLETVAEIGFPMIIKPVHEGSSIGMSKVDNPGQLHLAWQSAARYDSAVLAEAWIEGSEYTAAIMGDLPLPLIKLETDNIFYDYQAKYESNETRYLLPCGLDVQQETELQQLSLSAFKGAAAAGWGRVDLMLDQEGEPWLIEVNTVPGMTDHSLVPMAAKAAGMDFPELVWQLLAQTLEQADAS